MSCTICNHPQRQAIDQALVAGSATLAALGQEYGLSTSALHRHKAHLQAKISQAQGKLQENLLLGCFFWLSQALEMSMRTAQAAEAENNHKGVLQSLGQGIRIIAIILKQDFQLAPEAIYQILVSSQWANQAGLLPDDPQILALIRQTQAEAFASPCSETTGAPPASPEDLDPVQENPLGLAQPAAQPKTENRKLETENRLSKQREKGGKLPGKTPLRKDNNQKIQEDTLYEKITGIMDLPFRARQVPFETRNSKLETLFPGKIPGDKPLSEYIYEQNLKDSQCEKTSGKGASTQPHRPANGNGAPNLAA